MPKDQEYDNNSDGDSWMQATTVGIRPTQVFGEFTTIRLDVWAIFGSLAFGYLFLALGFGNEAVEFVLAFRSVDMNASEATGIAG